MTTAGDEAVAAVSAQPPMEQPVLELCHFALSPQELGPEALFAVLTATSTPESCKLDRLLV